MSYGCNSDFDDDDFYDFDDFDDDDDDFDDDDGPGSNPDQNNPRDKGLHNGRRHILVNDRVSVMQT